MKIRPGMSERVKRMRAKYPPDRLRGLIDIGSANPRKGRQPCASGGTVDTRNGCAHGPIARII